MTLIDEPRSLADMPTFDAAEILGGEGDYIQHGRIRVGFVFVDGPLALHWLAKYNNRNRNITDTKVAGHARDMLDGNWPITGDTIRFALLPEGEEIEGERILMIDGQHRASAIARSSVGQWCIVVTGLDPEVQTVVDTVRPRSLADDLAMAGVSNAPLAGAVARRLVIFRRGSLPQTGGQAATPTKTEQRVFHDANAEAIQAAVKVGVRAQNGKLKIPGSVLASAYFLAAEKDQDIADLFYVEQVAQGKHIADTDPAYRLRYKINRSDVDRLTPNELFLYCVKAWNHFRKGEQIRTLQKPAAGWPTDMSTLPIY